MSESFPFALEHIVSWIIRRKDGTVIRFNLISAEEFAKQQQARAVGTAAKQVASTYKSTPVWGPAWQQKKSYSEWCNHTPSVANEPIFALDGIHLYIADAPGAREAAHQFDVAVDGGSVLSVSGEYDLPNLYGSPRFVQALDRFTVKKFAAAAPKEDSVEILKIRWNDRCAPPVHPEFWMALLGTLRVLRDKKRESSGNPDRPLTVVTICQGGHGRSGSALAALMMCLTDMTPLDVLTHIRALHCARAIESKDQHIYLNSLATFLHRDADALDAEDVKSFKDRFLTVPSKWFAPYVERVKTGLGAKVAVREESFL